MRPPLLARTRYDHLLAERKPLSRSVETHRSDAACTCPFCSNEVAPVKAPARVVVGRLSRSALFAAGAAGLALATTDCGSMSSAYGGPPCGTSADGSDTCNITASVLNDGASGNASDDAASEDAAEGSSSTPEATGEGAPNDGGSLEAAYGAAVIPTDAFSEGGD